MKRFTITLVAILALVLGIGATVVLEKADAAGYRSMIETAIPNTDVGVRLPAAVDTIESGTPWTGYRFNSKWICAQNDIGTLWNIEGASSAFESGIVNGDPVTVNLTHYGPGGDFRCTDHYAASQTIRFTTENVANGKCWQMSYDQSGGRYTNQVTIFMNIHSSVFGCRDTLQHRNNLISRAIGTALGLLQFYSDTAWQASIMNTKFVNTYNFAGADDRNSLYALY